MNAVTKSERRTSIFVAIALATFSVAILSASSPPCVRADDYSLGEDYALKSELPIRLRGLLDTRIVTVPAIVRASGSRTASTV